MRKLAVLALLALLVLVAFSLWTEKRTHPKDESTWPVAASGGKTLEFRHGRVRFAYAPGLFEAAHGSERPAAPFVADEVPDGVGPAHVEILFDTFAGAAPRASVTAAIDIYPVEDFDDPEFGTREQNLPLKELTLLRERLAAPAGRGAALETSVATAGFMPYLPVVADAGQVVAARLLTLRGPGVLGLRYLTAYSQESAPLVDGQLFYTFQGLTSDQQHYVAASFPLRSGFLPERLPDHFDLAAFEREIATYQRETAATLEARPDSQFTPALDLLDALVQSITFE